MTKEVEEILSQLRDGDKLIYNITANVIEQQQKCIDELEEKLKEVEHATRNVSAFIKKAEQMLREQKALIELREYEWDAPQKAEAWGVKRGIERIINFAKRHYV